MLQLYSLNPCFNGRYSQSFKKMSLVDKSISLNPCFNGRYSQSVAQEDGSYAEGES